MTVDQIKAVGISLSMSDDMTELYVNAALEWLAANTTFPYDPENPPEELPANVKLFIIKFSESMSMNDGITSESIEGLSQSFADTGSRLTAVWQLANMLLSEYMPSSVKAVQTRKLWT